MKTIGLIGGITWHSSLDYYRFFNQMVNERLGGDNSAKIILNSVNYGDIKRLTQAGNWAGITDIIGGAAKKAVMAGADCILLGANTMHHIADEVQAMISVPLIHIADATAKAITEQGISTIALLGTKYTMQFEFYKKRLLTHGIQTLIPDEAGVEYVNKSIYEELGKGIFLPETRQGFLDIIAQLAGQGAGGAILGCTEIPLLIKQEHSPVPVFDTTFLHAKAALDFVLE
ncbi:MAG: aspartate/glutamate racemase family protein [Chitinophagaceae bacterium]|nr:aspartate/glutamate racemase family protein [Chitinophagaceae bacterium]